MINGGLDPLSFIPREQTLIVYLLKRLEWPNSFSDWFLLISNELQTCDFRIETVLSGPHQYANKGQVPSMNEWQ